MLKMHLSWLKSSMSALFLACLSLAFFTACDRLYGSSSSDETTSSIPEFEPAIVFKVAYENKPGEPLDIGFQQWKTDLERRSFGTMTLELYPNSKLGSKGKVLERIAAGENLITTADGAFFYGLGQKDMGIVFGPYLASNWDEAFNINKSIWYQKQTLELAKKTGIKVISADWAYGARHLLTTKPLNTPDDLIGLKIRVPSNIIQEKGFEIFGAKPIQMALGDVNAALSSGQIDGLENPITTLYNGGFHHTAKYLMLTGHVYNVVNIVISQKQWNKLNASQQRMLVDSCNRAAKFYNVVHAADELTTLNKLKAEGVTVVDPNQAILKALRLKAKNFYELPEFDDWPDNLYNNLQRIKGRAPDKNIDLMTHSAQLNVSFETPEDLAKASEEAAISAGLVEAPAATEEATTADEGEDTITDETPAEGTAEDASISSNVEATTNLPADTEDHVGIAGEAYYVPIADEFEIILEENPPRDTNPIWDPAKQGPKVPQLDIPMVAPLGDFDPKVRAAQQQAAQQQSTQVQSQTGNQRPAGNQGQRQVQSQTQQRQQSQPAQP